METGSAGCSFDVSIDAPATRTRLAALAESIETGGVGADPTALLLIAHTARDLGVNPLLVSVLVDDGEPEVVRERAFGRISAQLEGRLDAVHTTAMLPVTC